MGSLKECLLGCPDFNIVFGLGNITVCKGRDSTGRLGCIEQSRVGGLQEDGGAGGRGRVAKCGLEGGEDTGEEGLI